MNISSILGYVIAILVVYFGVVASISKPEIFLNSHALILVFGGTITAAFVSFPMAKLANIARFFVKSVLFGKKLQNSALVQNIIEGARVAKTNPNALTNVKMVHPFLNEAFSLVADGVLNENDLEDVLQRRSEHFKTSYMQDAKIFQSLSKYPPAFGLLGAVSGMVAMMLELGSSKPEQIGAAMGVALIATFWGIAVANIILLPLADYYMKLAVDDNYQRKIIVEGALLVKRRESPIVVIEKLNSYLPINERLNSDGNSEKGRKAA